MNGTLRLITRAECGLCGEMEHELRALAARVPLPPVTLVDVDSDPELCRRYGLKVPVLLLDSIAVCSHRLDSAELLRLLRRA
ncbi:MAG TPA: glutaredoxin family protein [Steroidobacteraceae bacterium]